MGAADILENLFHLITIALAQHGEGLNQYPTMIKIAYFSSLTKWEGVFFLFLTIIYLLAKKFIFSSAHRFE